MLARSAKPKLTLSVATGPMTRPALSLKSPGMSLMPPRSPISPMPLTPTTVNTKMNQRGLTTMQQPTYAYANNSASKSILKKDKTIASSRRQLQFSEKLDVRCITPIDAEDYYGSSKKMSKDERRWQSRP